MNMELQNFAYNKVNKTLAGHIYHETGPFPKELFITSNYTGRVVKFVWDSDKAYDMDFWDGELMEYIPVNMEKNVSRVVLTY